MKNVIPKNNQQHARAVHTKTVQTGAVRAGTTLAEILVTLGIMAIGITLIASLFPASVTQSIRASQLTNATLLKYEAQQQIDLQNMLPDYDAIHSGEPIGHVDVQVIDPIGYWTEPVDETDFAKNHNKKWGPVRRVSGGVTNNETSPDTQQSFALQSAKAIALSQDSWVTDYSNTAESMTAGGPIIMPVEDADALSTTQELISAIGIDHVRVLVESADSTRSFTSPVTSVSGVQIFLATAPNPEFVGNIETVRVQHLEERYSWMITSRSKKISSGLSSETGSKIVVFFRRSFSSLNEKTYTTTAFDRVNRIYTINWTGEEKPLLRKGSYLFDPGHGLWYRIEEIESSDDANKTANVVLNKNPSSGETPKWFMIPVGVVHVFNVK